MRTFLLCCTALAAQSSAQAGPLHDAAAEGDLARMQELLESGDKINRVDPMFGTALNRAAMAGQVAVVEFLIAKGARFDRATGIIGLTPLQAAASSGSAEIVSLLLAAGADPEATDASGNTALHMAADTGRADVVERLLAGGADFDAENAKGHQPVEVAGAAGHFDLVETFLGLGALSGPPVEPVSALLRSADPGRGADLFRSYQCSHCHAVEKDGKSLAPPLWGVVGRSVASLGAYNYSQTLRRAGGDWSYERLNAFMAYPRRFAPGNKMAMASITMPGGRVAEASERADLIAFIRLQSDDPLPLPE